MQEVTFWMTQVVYTDVTKYYAEWLKTYFPFYNFTIDTQHFCEIYHKAFFLK